MDTVGECRDINELHPKVKELALKLLEKCKEEGLNIKIGETYRTVARQDELYARGRTAPGRIVTYARGNTKSSYHQWRLAFDVFQNVKGDAYNINVLKKVGKIGRELGLEWGGDWKSFRDYPHFQYTFGLSIKDLRSGKRPPTVYEEKKEEVKEVKVTTPVPDAKRDLYYEKAVGIIVDKKIITSKDYWINVVDLNPEYVKSLVIKCAKYLDKGPVTSYEEAVDICAKYKVIGSVDFWKKVEKIRKNHIKSFIIKVSGK